MNKFSIERVDFSILVPALLLVFISLSTFYSIDTTLFRQQLIFLIIALVFYLIFLNLNFRIFAIYSKQIYFFSLFILLITFIIGIEAKGAVRWIEFLGIRIQFSEVLKPFFIIFMSAFLSSGETKSLLRFVKTILLISPIIFLILKQPDLGSASVYFVSAILTVFIYGFPLSYLISLSLLILIPLPLLYNFLHDYQKDRILTFFNSSHDPFGSSYNAIQALISIGSGGIFGKGYGQATQSILRFLPERHTDFIFATITESLGFIGGGIILFLYVYLLFRIYKIAKSAQDSFSYLVVMGAFFLFLTQTFFNIGMNLGLLPIVGITLPFMSYGGSSLLTSFILLGIISSISFESRNKILMEIR
ncbi:rod shape-determining protein RodA [Candidatus Parcubacteria bacterium]|nr:MAG: rod shape-determining protein RodA [Candidatus Parcubacteria bacterium]